MKNKLIYFPEMIDKDLIDFVKKNNLCKNIVSYLFTCHLEDKIHRNRRDLQYISDPMGWEKLLDYFNLEENIKIDRSISRNTEETVYI